MSVKIILNFKPQKLLQWVFIHKYLLIRRSIKFNSIKINNIFSNNRFLVEKIDDKKCWERENILEIKLSVIIGKGYRRMKDSDYYIAKVNVLIRKKKKDYWLCVWIFVCTLLVDNKYKANIKKRHTCANMYYVMINHNHN